MNVLPLEGGHKGRGVGVYTRLLVRALRQYEPDHTITEFIRLSDMPRQADVVHYPFFDPFFLTLPGIRAKPLVVTVHDLIPIVYPEAFPRGIRGEIKWQLQRRNLKSAARIITDSESSKKDINRLVGFPNDKIDVVYLAPPEISDKNVNVKRSKELLKRYKLNNKYILYVGDVNWNKNLPNIVKSIHAVMKSGEKLNAVFIGKAFLDPQLRETRELSALIAELGMQEVIRLPGYVSDEDLGFFYAEAACSIQASLAEGFGLPVLEAMQFGCPVITSDTSSLAEIAGPAITVNPHSIESIAEGLKKALSLSGAARDAFIQKQVDWAGGFTWKRVARETVAVYERAAARG